MAEDSFPARWLKVLPSLPLEVTQGSSLGRLQVTRGRRGWARVDDGRVWRWIGPVAGTYALLHSAQPGRGLIHERDSMAPHPV